MKDREFEPTRLPVEAFAKERGTLEGVWPLTTLERLAASVVAGSASGDVTWRAKGELRPVRGAPAEVWLHVEAVATLMLECQRCLGPVATPVQVERSFRFVHGESAAAELDADSEADVLALTRALDLRELLEDELLLSLPLVPRHETCPQPLVAGGQADAVDGAKPNPFAALAALKRGGLPN
ncbi:MAG: DUF177 domain-containing protein [Rhizobacter sp.]|nr:DUF177 domain-containing protein [Rhizobacter sp.]